MKRKSYAKSELAMLYFPDSDPHVATVRLMGWIRRCHELHDRLTACHSSCLLIMSIPRYQPERSKSLVGRSQDATFKINFSDDFQAP